MNNFEVIIDYENVFQNNTVIGSGMRGTIFNYQGDIVKIQESHCGNIEYYPVYSNRFPYVLTNDDLNYINKCKKLASIVNNLEHFIKIKGVLICPNLSGKKVFAKCVYRSIIYENAGQLTRKKLPFDKKNALQLLKIFESFKKFNLAGWFHEDIQGCNNIEPNQFNNLYVIDYEDLAYVNNRTILKNIKIDIYKMLTCITSYIQNKSIAIDDDIEFEIDLIILQKYLERKPISYETSNLDDKQVANVIVKGGIIYTQENSNYIENQLILEINNKINECVKIFESIKNIQVNICKFRFLMENSIENYNAIMYFISNIINYLNSEDFSKINKCIDSVVKKIIINFYKEHMYFNFDDIKYIIKYFYDKKIEDYKNYIKNYNQ